MKIPPHYTITPEILEMIVKIEANRIFLDSISIKPEIKEKIQRVSILKSSLYSARIEGNPLTIESVEVTHETQQKLEVFNILEAYKFIEKDAKKNIKLHKEDVLSLHKLVMKDLVSEAGYWRGEMGAIFNQAGVAVYVSPLPGQIAGLMDDLIAYINSEKEKFPLITAFMAHLLFEKIHPFIDGNGRVGRLLTFIILQKKMWRFSLNIVLEEYLDAHKEDYYYYLDIGLKEPERYLLFMLEAFWSQTEKVKSQVEEESGKTLGMILPPRQDEIYSIIRDHKVVSFDTIRRRFLKVPKRTLRYDLKKLQDKGVVVKTGNTKGTFYSCK